MKIHIIAIDKMHSLKWRTELTEKQLLEKILTSNIILISMLIDAEKKTKGTHRIGGDYSAEAITLIASLHKKLLKSFYSNQ